MQVSAAGNVKVAVIGAGYWGKNLVRVFAELGNLVAICDSNLEVSGPLGAQHAVPVLSLSEVLADDDIDAVAIAAPAVLHAKLAAEALRAGKHVFVEKPLALEVTDAEGLVELAAEVNRTLMVGHLLQYHPAFLRLKDLLDEGAIGTPQYFYSNRLNLGKIRREEDILWSFAPHDISMILSLAGEEPDTVLSVGSTFVSPKVADVTLTHLSFPSGARGHVFVSWLHPYKEQRLVVVGSEGMITFDDTQGWDAKLQHYAHRIDWAEGAPIPVRSEGVAIPLSVAEPLKLELEHFVACVRDGLVPRTDGSEGTRVLRVLARASATMLETDVVR